MRCPYCRSLEDRVIDSRLADDGGAIRRRRECAGCSKRFTTFERAEVLPLVVVKRSGERIPFERARVESGIAKACVNRPVEAADVTRIAEEIEDAIRSSGQREVSTADIGVAVLDRLGEIDEVAYMRFASVYKEFTELTDFEREVGLLQKRTPPKARVVTEV